MNKLDKCSTVCTNYKAHMGRCQFCTTTDFFYIKVHNLCKSKLMIVVHKTDTTQALCWNARVLAVRHQPSSWNMIQLAQRPQTPTIDCWPADTGFGRCEYG